MLGWDVHHDPIVHAPKVFNKLPQRGRGDGATNYVPQYRGRQLSAGLSLRMNGLLAGLQGSTQDAASQLHVVNAALHINADKNYARGNQNARRGYGSMRGRVLADGVPLSSAWQPLCMEAQPGARDIAGPSSVKECMESSDAVVIDECAREDVLQMHSVALIFDPPAPVVSKAAAGHMEGGVLGEKLELSSHNRFVATSAVLESDDATICTDKGLAPLPAAVQGRRGGTHNSNDEAISDVHVGSIPSSREPMPADDMESLSDQSLPTAEGVMLREQQMVVEHITIGKKKSKMAKSVK